MTPLTLGTTSPFDSLAATAFLTGPFEARVDLTPGFLGTAAAAAAVVVVLDDRGFLDAKGEALDEVLVAAEAGLDVAAFLAAVEAVGRLRGAREAAVAGLVVDEAAGAAVVLVVVLAVKGARGAAVPFGLAEVVVLAGEAVRVTVDLTAVAATFLSAMGLVVGVGLFWVTGDALAAAVGLDIGAGLDVAGPPVVVLGAVVGLEVLVVEPGAGLVVGLDVVAEAEKCN